MALLDNSYWLLNQELKYNTFVQLTKGNKILREYYTGATADNPSGAYNIYRATYIRYDATIDMVIEYKWDANDNCISEERIV